MRVGKTPSRAARVMNYLLTASLVLGLPGAGTVSAAATGATSSSLSVESDPAGAALYVDGELAGTPPPAVFRMLSLGDHRIRVVKDGYLENSRVVRIEAGRTERL